MTGGQDHFGDAVRQRLAEIRQRADAATDGPWSAADEHSLLDGAEPAWCVSRMRPGHEAMSETEGYLYDIAYTTGTNEQVDAEFIADARSSVPRLVAAFTAILDIHDDNGHGWCQGCGWNTTFAGWTTRIDECRVRSAVAAALEEQP